ncbi:MULTISPECIES: Crp/Fnr family transcriptional regulator [Rhodopseudomonas]|nr:MULTISPECIES: Crp/Fnr family transcriptional regulator [Rhodopseudomonas]
MAQRVRDLFIRLESTATRPAQVRLAEALLKIDIGKRANGGETGQHELTQEALAMIVGVTRQTVNKILGDFERRGLVSLHYKRIEVVDRSAIQRIALPWREL